MTKDTEKNLDLLKAVEQVVENAKGAGLSKEFYKKSKRYISYLSKRLDLTMEQSVIMALFIDFSNDLSVTLQDFSSFLDCSTTRILRYAAEIEVLVNRKLIRCNHGGDCESYRVPKEVIKAFKDNEKFAPVNYTGLTCRDLFDHIDILVEQRRNGEILYLEFVDELHDLFNCNKHLLFVQRLLALQLNELDEMLLILFCNLFVNDGEEYFYFQDIDFLHDRKGRLRHTMFCMGEGTNELVKLKLVESKLDDGFANRYSLHLTTDAKQSLFEELDIVIEQPKVRRDMILAKDIVHKNLYYGDTVTKKISELGGLLEDSQYRNIIQRLKDKGFRSGFACLLYGDPGTGKTETVLQLAKQTGRDIMQVNLSQIKSKWVGDSEKNIKAVFDCYRRRAKECEKTPILLFNEADGVISRRKENAENSVDKMENTMQNIILQEMETFEGIMIATTNLAQNMDKAFERRFLYKIKFEKPTMEARLNMWHDMIPELDENDTQIIAEMFNFSGGQIENIARRYTIDSILNESSANRLESLISFCEDEVVDYKPKRKIGY